MRSDAAIEKLSDATLSPIHPDALIKAIGSTVVETPTPIAPSLAGPIVNPVSVTVTAELEGIVDPAVLMTMNVADIDVEIPSVPPLIAAAGNAHEAKKSEGYVRVMLLPGAREPPAVVVNENVSATFIL